MPQQGVLTNLDNQVFQKGYLYGTRSGGASQAIGFGALQNVSVRDAFTWVDQRGPEALSPIGVGLGEENLTGSFESGVLLPEQFIMALGGSQTYDAATDYTVYTKRVNDEPQPFDIDCTSEEGSAPEVKCKFYRCLCNDWNIWGANNRQWMTGGGSFRVIGEDSQGSTRRLFTWSRRGNSTNAS